MATTPNQQTDVRKVYYQCRLGQSELERLFDVAREGISSPEIQISTVVGSTRFWNSNLSDLIATLQASTPETSGKWTNISMEAKNSSMERSVSISIDTERTEFNFSGSDSTWVYGQSARLENLLATHGAVRNSPRYEARISIFFALFFLGIGALWAFGDLGEETVEECMQRAAESKDNQLTFNIIMGALLSFGILFILFQFLKRRSLRAQLSLNSAVAGGTWWSRLSVGEKIAAIGIPIASLATIGTLVSAASDAIGK
ncbi:hypothetical protein [Streptomyces parvulus]|uniref:hypothetical protein n=1 Tax=Streptomyces parvulus TaxID=146923 RepID=UPI0036E2AA7D